VAPSIQRRLFPQPVDDREVRDETTSTFADNMRLPVHRWFRFSAGFSAQWVISVIEQHRDPGLRVLDPFAGSGTTLIASETAGVPSVGIEAHPFVARVARAKLEWRSDPEDYLERVRAIRDRSLTLEPQTESYPRLVHKCYDRSTIEKLDVLRRACDGLADDSPAGALAWLTFVSILRQVSHAGTAQWQYVLPNKKKSRVAEVYAAFDRACQRFYEDMLSGQQLRSPRARFVEGDARQCEGVDDRSVNLVITSPPYPNNYDYADATRLEMSVMKEITGWGDLQKSIRRHLVRSCSQHVPEKAVQLDEILESEQVSPIRDELAQVCGKLAEVRLSKGGRKTYHLMVACYFHDLAQVWHALRRVCDDPARLCFVIGDSAPYGVYVPVIGWLGGLAEAAGFKSWSFEKTRDRNTKWKNRKHRVPLCEGRLWVQG